MSAPLPVDVWFGAWLIVHRRRHAMAKLPELANAVEFYEGWAKVMAIKRIDRDAAEHASIMLLATKHYPKDHFETLCRLAVEARFGPYAARVEAATDASKACEHCRGEGRASVTDRATKMRFAVPCVCEMGRLMLANDRREAGSSRIVMTFADVLDGRTTYRAILAGREFTLDFSGEEGASPESRRLAASASVPEFDPVF